MKLRRSGDGSVCGISVQVVPSPFRCLCLFGTVSACAHLCCQPHTVWPHNAPHAVTLIIGHSFTTTAMVERAGLAALMCKVRSLWVCVLCSVHDFNAACNAHEADQTSFKPAVRGMPQLWCAAGKTCAHHVVSVVIIQNLFQASSLY